MVVVRPGESRRVRNVEFLARTDDTPRFNLALITIQPHRGEPPVHAHEAEDDAFYIFEDELTFVLDDSEVFAGPGTFVLVPPSSSTHSRIAETRSSASSTCTRRRVSTGASKRTSS